MAQRNLVLILARDLADKLASAVFVVDRVGTLVYYNERAGELLGQTYAEAGSMRVDQWSRAFEPSDVEGRPLDPSELPLVKALSTQKPDHSVLHIRALDGSFRDIGVTALPLFARRDEFVGAVAFFWEIEDGSGGAG
jgi:PAS domain-containing protein